MYVQLICVDISLFAEIYACELSSRSRLNRLCGFDGGRRGDDVRYLLSALGALSFVDYLNAASLFLLELRRSIHILSLGSFSCVGIIILFAAACFLVLFVLYLLGAGGLAHTPYLRCFIGIHLHGSDSARWYDLSLRIGAYLAHGVGAYHSHLMS